MLHADKSVITISFSLLESLYRIHIVFAQHFIHDSFPESLGPLKFYIEHVRILVSAGVLP
jgi:hypothetical protein